MLSSFAVASVLGISCCMLFLRSCWLNNSGSSDVYPLVWANCAKEFHIALPRMVSVPSFSRLVTFVTRAVCCVVRSDGNPAPPHSWGV